jgi:penicillin-binding protein 1A
MWPFGRGKSRARDHAGDGLGFDRGTRDGDWTGSHMMAAKPRSGWRRRFRLFVVTPLVAALLVTTAAGLLFVHYSMTFPDPLSLRHKERAPIIRILAADGSVLAERGAAHDYVPLDLIPRHVTDAVVATEDRRFYVHKGIDPFGLVRAMFANLRARRYAQGGSTLTQQLAKNIFLTSERTLSRKLEEVALALWLEMRLGKQDILELYLNRVYFGAGAYGIEAAAQRYFDKPAQQLTLAEGAVIAGLLKAPSKYSPLTSPGVARARGRAVLKKMLAAGLVRLDAEAEASRRIVKFAAAKTARDTNGIEYAIDYVLERMPPLLGNGHAEVIVETTIDAKLQRRAQSAVERTLQREGEAAQAGQASVVVLDTDGGIAALVGGKSYAESQYNRAVKSKRQPGSAFKPFVYLAALEAGRTPESTVHDLPVTIDGWTPRNDNGQFRGAVTLRQGLALSINTVAARLQYEVGAKRVIAIAQRLGIKSELRPGPSLALGTSETTLLEMTGGYTAFANGGRRVEPHIIKRVRISSGRVLYMRPPTATQIAIAPLHVGAMNDMLHEALVNGTGRRAALALHPAAGKTGTSQDYRDAWFVGYTAHLVCGVWVGNDQGLTMNNVRGGSLPASIWREIMAATHEGRAVVALPGTVAQPASVAQSGAAARDQRQPALTMPRDQIGADFVARALRTDDAHRTTAPAPRAEPPRAFTFPRFAPESMMSLGRKSP